MDDVARDSIRLASAIRESQRLYAEARCLLLSAQKFCDLRARGFLLLNTAWTADRGNASSPGLMCHPQQDSGHEADQRSA